MLMNNMPMHTKEHVLRVLTHERPSLERRFRVRRLALFGSYARGDYRPDSDVDVLVDVDPSIGLDFVTLAETLEHALGLPVDLVSRRALDAKHWEAIAADVIDV